MRGASCSRRRSPRWRCGGPLDALAHGLADVGLAHTPADVVRVAYGGALVRGIDLDAVIAWVHRSDLTEPGSERTVGRSADGKVRRGDRHEAPDGSGVLRRQGRTLRGRDGGRGPGLRARCCSCRRLHRPPPAPRPRRPPATA
ncbi:nucleoside triphosphate pyrophosphohydrolase family protein [Streptomyces olivaceus]|uniref:hypothetical protein n=1 Tax=Streptomyces olivaceus TaxID=47716 RepID=UPI00389A73B7